MILNVVVSNFGCPQIPLSPIPNECGVSWAQLQVGAQDGVRIGSKVLQTIPGHAVHAAHAAHDASSLVAEERLLKPN